MLETLTLPKQRSLITPYGGELQDLVSSRQAALELHAYAKGLPAISLSARALCDLELLATGAFSPLDRFMSEADYRGVIQDMRLSSGYLFPIPVTLAVGPEIKLRENTDVALCDAKQNPLAIMRVEEIYEWRRSEFSNEVLGTENLRHPLNSEMNTWGDRNVSGPLRVIETPRHYDFPELRLSPREVRERLTAFGNGNVVAFQTRNPLHRAHEEITK